jgi:hypothetical protein
MAAKYNFNAQYCTYFDDPRGLLLLRTRPDQSCYQPLALNEIVTDGTREDIRVNTDLFHTLPYRFTEFKYLVTPNEFYTNYEKLIMPFDMATWVLLWMTFGLTFVIIFVINRMPKKFRVAVYGDRVNMPTYNAVGVFFGIGQTRLPKENFSRILLLLFIWFCLIFRTCHQYMRKPLPETLDDLRDQNYTVILHKDNSKLYNDDVALLRIVHYRILTDRRER